MIRRKTNTAGLSLRQKGMSLLEVVVSMLIIGIALAMSISMLQTANRYGESAEYRAAALQQAQSIIDRMRANNIAAEAYIFSGGASGSSYDDLYKADMSKIPAELTCGSGAHAGCIDALPTARSDMQQWRESLQQLLPGGKGVIQQIGVGTNSFRVYVMWHNNPESEAVQQSSAPQARGISITFSL